MTLRNALRKWVQASGIAGDPDSVRVVELVPHYTKLLCLLNDQHSSRQLSASKILTYLRVLYSFYAAYLLPLHSRSVDFAAMLSNIKSALTMYGKLAAHNRQVKTTVGCQQGAAAAAAAEGAAAGPAASAGLGSYGVPVSSTAAAEAAAGAPVAVASVAQLNQQQLQLGRWHTGGRNGTTEHGSLAADVASGRSLSMAHLLQQLQSGPSLGAGYVGLFVRLVGGSAACFDGVRVDAIPASLLLTNYIAEVGDRAQQCLSARAVGQQDDDRGADFSAVEREVEGLLQLSGQPVLLQLLGGQRLQELVEGLMRCKQLLSEIHCSVSSG
jgi:hypothetical protein